MGRPNRNPMASQYEPKSIPTQTQEHPNRIRVGPNRIPTRYWYAIGFFLAIGPQTGAIGMLLGPRWDAIGFVLGCQWVLIRALHGLEIFVFYFFGSVY